MAEQGKETALATVQSESGLLLQMAIQKDLDVEKLKILMDLRDREERKNAEREFEARFAEMQREYVPALKSKEVHTKDGRVAYAYCPLSVILSIYAPILAKHGFSYRWEESDKPSEKEKVTTCVLSGHGFSRMASISLPYSPENQLINPIQARGATSEYGRRYTFMNVTGCIVADDEDKDAVQSPNVADIKKQIAEILPFIPIGFRAKYQGAETSDALVEAANLRARCKAIINHPKLAKMPKEKEKVAAWVKKATSEGNLADCEAHIESL